MFFSTHRQQIKFRAPSTGPYNNDKIVMFISWNFHCRLPRYAIMNCKYCFSLALLTAMSGMLAPLGFSQTASTGGDYKIINSSQTMGSGRIDYVYADNDGRRIYVPRGNQILVFDLDTLKAVGAVTNSGGHGVAVDPATRHGFSSMNPITMFDTTTLATIKSIKVEGRPDGILFEPATKRVYILSHEAPNVTALDAADGSIAGTVDLGGAPEQAVSDGKGHVYIDLEDKDQIAVVDANALKCTGHYSLGGKGGGPAGLGFDVKNRILFAMCHDPATCVIMGADDGKIMATLPIGKGTDNGGFNPNTMEAFSSQGDGTLTIIKENSPTSFEVEQTVATKSRAKTCALDTRNNHIILITTEPVPGAASVAPPTNGRQRGGGPGLLDILVVGR
jgi:DNA-binding beta-propeller fold protein YncE